MEIINKENHVQKVGADTPWACGVACGSACIIFTPGALFGHIIVSY